MLRLGISQTLKNREKEVKKMGNKTEIIRVRVTEKEKELIYKNAAKAGLDFSKYVRHVAISKQPIIIKDIGDLEEVESKIGNIEYEINKLGVNINQIAKVLNEGNVVPSTTINSLLKVLKRLDSRMEKINEVIAKSYDEIYK